ncbi:MAG: HAMP domain-containing histidine kinase [Tissierellia bacterium]|nr:HAMP domain-containing histidine kinase [Tissierellia bacterium]
MKRMRLFPKLMLSFFLFALAVLLALMVSLVSTGCFIIGETEEWGAYAVMDDTGEPVDPERVYRLNGWIEKIDADNAVVAVYGDKRNDAQRYTQTELTELIGAGETKNTWVGFLSAEQNGMRLLTLYQRNDIGLQPQLNISSENTDASWVRIFFGIFGTLFVLIMLGMSFFLVRQIRRPLKTITEGLRRVREGEEGVQLDFTAEADFKEIRDTFNTMTKAMKQQQEEKKEAAKKRARLLLELSHDIRTPVATVKSIATALSENLVPQDDKPRYYQVITEKADRIGELSESLFTMLKMEDKEAVPQKENTDICELVREVCSHYYSEMETAGLEFTADLPDQALPLSMDRQLMARAIGNLIENAIYYNQTGKAIQVEVKEETAALHIRVFDDGQMIPPEDRPHLFDAFSRGDRARTSRGGTGLGLSIAKTITEKHGGTILYRAENGNSFIITLPLTR